MRKPYFALSSSKSAGVTAFCEVIRRGKNTITFDCVNGLWRGSYHKTKRTLSFPGTDREPVENVELIWEGKWPTGTRDYNEAIKAINEELKAKG